MQLFCFLIANGLLFHINLGLGNALCDTSARSPNLWHGQLLDSEAEGVRCSFMVRTFVHGAMGRWIDPSWWTH